MFSNFPVKKVPKSIDETLLFQDDDAFKEMALQSPTEMYNLILQNRIITEGSLASLAVFNLFISLIAGKIQQNMVDKLIRKNIDLSHLSSSNQQAVDNSRLL